MWTPETREASWKRLPGAPYDLVIVGGGITGAGLLREAVRVGLRAVLLEAKDFAWGTSSRSSKMVHGGLRYLQHAQLRVTLESVQERERLLREAPGLVDPLGFLIAVYSDRPEQRVLYGAGLALYDSLARTRQHRYHPAPDFTLLAPHLRREGLSGGYAYADAQTDDARLVLRVLREAVRAGGTALSGARVLGTTRSADGGRTVAVRDEATGRRADLRARVVVNATGAVADGLRRGRAVVRPLRGSHLVFPQTHLPTAQAVAFSHPLDGRNVFVTPWHGHTLVGTTDLDHAQPLTEEPRITPEEATYLMAGVTHAFPDLPLRLRDATASWAGVRPVVGTGKADPSKESRDALILDERGLISVTGGKLTTFRAAAHAVLERLEPHLGAGLRVPGGRFFGETDADALPAALTARERRRLAGQYGAEAPDVVRGARDGELEAIPGTPTLWAELRHAARCEGVRHLDDLLLRRARLGFYLPNGGSEHLDRVRLICEEELGWTGGRWARERDAYLRLWRSAYAVPSADEVPDWRLALARREAVGVGGRR